MDKRRYATTQAGEVRFRVHQPAGSDPSPAELHKDGFGASSMSCVRSRAAVARGRVTELEAADDYVACWPRWAISGRPSTASSNRSGVIADDPGLAANRIRLLGQVASLFSTIADFSKIQPST